MSFSIFLSVVLIHLAAAASPGPSFVVSVKTAASDGFVPAAALAFGFGLGALFWAAAAMAGLAVLFELVPALFKGLKVIGGAFLIYIAYHMWQGATAPFDDTGGGGPARPRSIASAVRFGFFTFASNPKTAVFFGAVFVGLVPADTPLSWRLALLAAIFLNEVCWYLIVARVFSFPKPRAAYIRLRKVIDRAFGALIALFGLKIALM